ncbi:MAG TPA: thioesterase family protein [Sphingorhabdus sp.]|nr:thioesterase family protein [Sphingorhabdus sp.]
MNLAEILAQLRADSTDQKISIPSTWHQGRTAYGGLSSALAYQSAKLVAPDLPPLLTAQIAFSGPLSGEVEIHSKILRRGRNSAFIKSEITVGDEVGLSCVFVFMARRESHIDFEGLPRPEFPPIPEDGKTRSGPPEFFTHNMDYPEKRLILGMDKPRLANWHRLKERDGLDPVANLICMGDALPPSTMGLMKKEGMISSINWQINLLTDAPDTENGWWFLESETHHAVHGASSQYMTVWNSKGEPMMTGMQSVALFV